MPSEFQRLAGFSFIHGRNPRLLKLRISMQAGRPAVFAGLFDGVAGHAPFAVRPALALALPVPLYRPLCRLTPVPMDNVGNHAHFLGVL